MRQLAETMNHDRETQMQFYVHQGRLEAQERLQGDVDGARADQMRDACHELGPKNNRPPAVWLVWGQYLNT